MDPEDNTDEYSDSIVLFNSEVVSKTLILVDNVELREESSPLLEGSEEMSREFDLLVEPANGMLVTIPSVIVVAPECPPFTVVTVVITVEMKTVVPESDAAPAREPAVTSILSSITLSLIQQGNMKSNMKVQSA
jgi:hypothetical protein